MPGNINWKLSIDGLDQNIIKLEKLDRLLNSVGRKMGSAGLGGSGGINNSGGNTTIVNGVPGSSGGAGLGAAEGAIAGSIFGKSFRSSFGKNVMSVFKEVDNISKELNKVRSVVAFMASRPAGATSNERDLQLKAYNFAKQKEKALSDLLQSKLPGASYEAAAARVSGNNVRTQWQKIKDIFDPNSPNGRRSGEFYKSLGGAVGGAIGGKTGAGIGGGVGGLLDKVLGTLALVIPEIVAAFIVLKFTIGKLVDGIKDGAAAYQHAAKMALGVEKDSAINYAFKAIGMESPDLARLQGRFNRNAKRYNPEQDSDIIIGAAHANQFGNAQQLVNMAGDFKHAMKDAQESARQMANSAVATQRISAQSSGIAREWHTMWTQLATALYPVISALQIFTKELMKTINYFIELLINIEQLLHLVPAGGTNFKRVGGGQGGMNEAGSSWEKIGFNFQNASPTMVLQEISKNTKDTVTALNRWAKQFGDRVSADPMLTALMP